MGGGGYPLQALRGRKGVRHKTEWPVTVQGQVSGMSPGYSEAGTVLAQFRPAVHTYSHIPSQAGILSKALLPEGWNGGQKTRTT